jgi:hypothetical protein
LWAPVEEVREFVRKAWEASAVLKLAQALLWKDPTPPELWPYLSCLPANTSGVPPEGWHQHRRDFSFQRRFIADIVNQYLAGYGAALGGPKLWMRWEQDEAPALQFHSGMGCIHTVWVEIAQALSNRHGFLQCDGCKTFYIRTGRRAQTGRNNFCPGCRGNNNAGSKRLSAARRREHQRLSQHNCPLP